ncbi:MAG: anaerobic ribonucleoside-triphosphate reductase activating protein, partial [Acutalibacteraceae bacterium]
MKIYGLQKMTLLDFPGKVACTLFTGGCNFRCPFCHNARLVTELDKDEVYSEEEIFEYLRKRVGILDGVCITGGEPLMNADIADFITKVRELGYAVKLDTNGSYPETLKNLIDRGLVDYIAMDIKNTPEKYAQTIGVKKFDFTPIKKSIEIIMQSGVPYEFRTTVV